MTYTLYQLIFFLLVYSFLGWCLEVAVMAVMTGRFCNRGFLNMPFSLTFGTIIAFMLALLPSLKGIYAAEFIAYGVVTSVCTQISSDIAIKATGHHLWFHENRSLFTANVKNGVINTLIVGGCACLIIVFIHPLFFIFSQVIPDIVMIWIDIVVCFTLFSDFILSIYSVHHHRKYVTGTKSHATLMAGTNPYDKLIPGTKQFAEHLEQDKISLGERITRRIWERIRKNYPDMQAVEYETEESAGRYTFAKGICVHKLIWVFLITAFFGDIIETIFVYLKSGVLMSRSSVLYGPFSVVWGIGAALLTLLLYRLADKEDRYIFIGGFFIGGTYEYTASLVLETVLGTKFWDYSNMPFNLQGRTNLLYCIFWGILGLVWIKFLYPFMSHWIEKIPVLAGVILTWSLVTLMACDLAISGLAILRYVERQNNMEGDTTIDSFMDAHYSDKMIEKAWPNLKISEDSQ